MVLKMVFEEYFLELKNCHEVILKVRSNISTHLCRHLVSVPPLTVSVFLPQVIGT